MTVMYANTFVQDYLKYLKKKFTSMKKLILALAFIMGITTVTVAQTAAPATQKAHAVKTAPVAAPKATTAAKTVPAAAAVKTTTAPAKVAPAATAAKTTAGGVVLKKDGTPDKRFKNAPAAAGPTKKDGTPDMRYKANKKG